MQYLSGIIEKFNRLNTHKKLSKKNFDLNTYEFVKVKDIYKKVKIQKILTDNNVWSDLFPHSYVKLNKIDYFIKDKSFNKYISHKTIGRSYKDLSNERNLIEGSIVIKLKNVTIKDNSLLTLINKNLSIMEIYGDDLWLNFRLNKWPKAHNYHVAKVKIDNKNIYKRIKIYSIEKKLYHIKSKAILLSPIREDNFFHWIFDTMSKLYLIEKIPKLKNLPLILRKPLNKYQKEMFEIFGVKNKIIFTNGKSFTAKNVIIPTIPSPPIYSKPTVTWLRKKFLRNINLKKVNVKRIYISRNDSNHRKIINDSEISNFLNKYNFKTLVLSKMNLRDQINYFRCADIIILPHGSGASHLIFAKKNCKIVELQSPSQINNSFGCLSKIIGAKYGFLVGDERKSNNFNYYIDIKKLKK